jgi:PPE-repeat protein
MPMTRRRLSAVLAAATLLVAPAAMAQSSLPAVSEVNGKVSLESGVSGGSGDTSGIGIAKGSITTPLGHSFGFQLDGLAGTSYDTPFFGGTAHLFWRDPDIGLIGPIVSIAGSDGDRVGWYGAEAEVYAGLFTLGAWGGYHDAVDNVLGIGANSGFYGGSIKLYATADLALSLTANSEFQQFRGNAMVEYQPTLFARHNMSFFVDGAMDDRSDYTVTAGIRLYFGPDKTLIRRHREDDPPDPGAAYEAAFTTTVPPPVIAANRAQQIIALGGHMWLP